MNEQTRLFVSGKDGYHSYRIPTLVASNRGTILGFCEGRKSNRSDSGDIDIVLRRSFDNGRTWEPTRVLVDDGPNTAGNPAPVVDRNTGIIWLFLCKNLADGPHDLIVEGKAPRTVWVTSSTDDGATWAEPTEITDDVKDPSWTWYATGPCHGIQLQTGRLVIPCDHVAGTIRGYDDVESSMTRLAALGHSHVIYSDDHGEHWRPGGSMGRGSIESQVVETDPGELYFNARTADMSLYKRVAARSTDGGLTWSQMAAVDDLPDPHCQGSIVRHPNDESHDRGRVIFANIANFAARDTLTLRVSYDECRTWPISKVLCHGPAAYSDLAIASDMTIACLYEQDSSDAHESIRIAQFNIEWLTDGADHLS